jgi:hypothetical protein
MYWITARSPTCAQWLPGSAVLDAVGVGNCAFTRLGTYGRSKEERHSPPDGLAITSAPGECGETTNQRRTTTAELSAPQRSTMDTSDKWFRLDNRGDPIWGSRGREFKSRQPDIRMADCHA